MDYKRIAIDTSKHVFTLHGVDAEERVSLRRELRRAQMVGFFAKLAPTEIVLEACGGSHHWGRVLTELGHRVRLIPAQYVKPFVKRAKNDRPRTTAMMPRRSVRQRPGLRCAACRSSPPSSRPTP